MSDPRFSRRVNMARCRKCGDVVVSQWRHDYSKCKCGQLAVDGGSDYTRRVFGDEGFDEMSTGFAPEGIDVPAPRR